MIKHSFRYFTVLLFCLLSIFTINRHASAGTVITDSANTLTAGEIAELQNYGDTIFKLHDTSIYIVTSKKIGAKDDYQGYLKQIKNSSNTPKNMVLLFVSTKSDTPFCHIMSNGKAGKYMTQSRCNTIIGHMKGSLKDKDYFSAAKTFCQETQRYMNKPPKFDNFLFHPVPQLIFCLLLSSVIIFTIVRNTAGKPSTAARTEWNCVHSELLGQKDHFSHTVVSRVKTNSLP